MSRKLEIAMALGRIQMEKGVLEARAIALRGWVEATRQDMELYEGELAEVEQGAALAERSRQSLLDEARTLDAREEG